METSSDIESIRALLARYMLAVDDMIARGDHNVDVIMTCFAPDAVVHYPGIEATGTEEIEGMFSGSRPRQEPELAGFSRLPVSTHAMMTTQIQVNEGEADACTNATANLCGVRDGREVILIRGLRYLDHLVKASQGWQISERHLVVDWMYEVPAMLITQPRFELPKP